MDNNVGIDCGRDRLDGSEQKGKNSDNYNSINNKINLKKKKEKIQIKNIPLTGQEAIMICCYPYT